MAPWVIRGIGMAVLHAVAATVLAKIAVFDPTGTTALTAVVIAALIGAAALWSALDAWLRRPDVGRTWFITAIVAGPVSGVLYVIGRAIFVDQTGVSELGQALTGGAAFTALLVLVPAGLGMLVGGKLERPTEKSEAEKAPPAGRDRQRASGKPAG